MSLGGSKPALFRACSTHVLTPAAARHRAASGAIHGPTAAATGPVMKSKDTWS